MSTPGPAEQSWSVNGLTLAGLSWGDTGMYPVLALHGWLDNAASFARLGPCLTGCHTVAMDLTGHGRSGHRSADSSYQIWDDLPEIMGVVDQLGWDTFALVGHSRGAIISTLLASAFPERVERLVLLDAVAPQPVPAAEFPTQQRRALLDRPALLGRPQSLFDDSEQAIKLRLKRGLSVAAATLLVERGLQSAQDKLTWSADVRLQGASAVKLTEQQIQAVLSALDMPTLLLLCAEASQDQANWMQQQASECIGDLRLESFPGGHHFHMEAAVADIARCMLEFFELEGARE